MGSDALNPRVKTDYKQEKNRRRSRPPRGMRPAAAPCGRQTAAKPLLKPRRRPSPARVRAGPQHFQQDVVGERLRQRLGRVSEAQPDIGLRLGLWRRVAAQQACPERSRVRGGRRGEAPHSAALHAGYAANRRPCQSFQTRLDGAGGRNPVADLCGLPHGLNMIPAPCRPLLTAKP